MSEGQIKMMQLEGTLIKGIGGFYYVEAADQIYECKAKGINRRKGIAPLAGDTVTITVNKILMFVSFLLKCISLHHYFSTCSKPSNPSLS